MWSGSCSSHLQPNAAQTLPGGSFGDLIMAEQQVCQTDADEEKGLQEERAAW